jgi:hypothetical protein
MYIYLLLLISVLRIHDILVWIRIRGSMPLTNGSGSCYLRKNIFLKFSAYYFLKVHYIIFQRSKV